MPAVQTVFQHIRQSIPTEDLKKPRRVFLVQFDGEWDIWYSKPNPSDAEVKRCMEELRVFYQEDWKGTARVLPVLNLTLVEYDSINCL